MYEYVHHILGRDGHFSGVPMHMGHFHGHMNRKIAALYPQATHARGFFYNAQCREFLTTGVCLWLQSMPSELSRPCCDHDVIGGDGTHIGIPVANALHLQDIWRTENQVQPSMGWGAGRRYIVRLDSIDAPHKEDGSPMCKADIKQARQFMSEVLDTIHPGDLHLGLEDIRNGLSKCIAPAYVEETMSWIGLPVGCRERVPLRAFLKGICSKASATHMLFDGAIAAWETIARQLDDQIPATGLLASLTDLRPAFFSGGFGPQIWTILHHQLSAARARAETCAVSPIRQSTIQSIALFGKTP